MLPWKPTVPSAEAVPPYITNYGSMDVLMGRGTPSVRHKGNIFFRSLIDKRKAEYIQCTTNEDKDIMARGIVDAVASHQGRFLQKVETAAQAASLGVPQGAQGNVWVLADEEVVLCKVKQAFRDLFKRGTRSTDTDPSSRSPSRSRQRGDAVGEEEDSKPAALPQSVAASQHPLDSMSLQFLRNQHQRGGHFSQGIQYPETSAGASRQITALLQQQQQQQNQNLYQQHLLGTGQAAIRQQGPLPPSSFSFLPSSSIPFQGVGNMPLSESERIKLALEIHYHRMRTGGANVLAPQHSGPAMSTDAPTSRVAAPASTMTGGGQATSGSTREGNQNDVMLSLLLERAIAQQQQQQQQASNQLAFSLPSFLQEQRAGMIPSQQPTTHTGTLNSMVLGMLQQQRQQQLLQQQPSPLEDFQRIQAERLREAQILAASRSSDAVAARLPPREPLPARLPPESKTSDVSSSKSSGPSSESGGDVDAKKTDRISLGAQTEKVPEAGLSPAARLPQESKDGGLSSDISSPGGADDTKRTDRKRRRDSDSEKKPRASSTR